MTILNRDVCICYAKTYVPAGPLAARHVSVVFMQVHTNNIHTRRTVGCALKEQRIVEVLGELVFKPGEAVLFIPVPAIDVLSLIAYR
jgi:hypothetical protein